MDQSDVWTSLAFWPVWRFDQSGVWTSLACGPVWSLDQSDVWTSLACGPVWSLDQSDVAFGETLNKIATNPLCKSSAQGICKSLVQHASFGSSGSNMLKNIICVYYLLQTLYRETLLLCVTRKCANKITKCIIDGAVNALLRGDFVFKKSGKSDMQHRMSSGVNNYIHFLSYKFIGDSSLCILWFCLFITYACSIIKLLVRVTNLRLLNLGAFALLYCKFDCPTLAPVIRHFVCT